MYRRIAAVAAASLILSGQAAHAAQSARITGVTGSVLVSQNGRFVPASNGAALRAGDRIVATGGSARVIYGDGCSVAVMARSMVTIGAASPCAGGSSGVVRAANPDGEDGYEESSTENSTEQSLEDGSFDCSFGGPRCSFEGSFSASPFMMWLGFGVVVATATAAAINDDSDPVSP